MFFLVSAGVEVESTEVLAALDRRQELSQRRLVNRAYLASREAQTLQLTLSRFEESRHLAEVIVLRHVALFDLE